MLLHVSLTVTYYSTWRELIVSILDLGYKLISTPCNNKLGFYIMSTGIRISCKGKQSLAYKFSFPANISIGQMISGYLLFNRLTSVFCTGQCYY